MQTTQAIVAVGGKGEGFRRGGLSVPDSKPFMEVQGRTLFEWILRGLTEAGIRRLVVAVDRPEVTGRAETVTDLLRPLFDEIVFFNDVGGKVHSIPFQVEQTGLQDPGSETFLFETGHGLVLPEHYRALDAAKRPGNVVFSAHAPHPSNPRQPVWLMDGAAVPVGSDETIEDGDRTAGVIAHPILFDREYAAESEHGDIHRILGTYAARGGLSYAESAFPLEPDTVPEYHAALPFYEGFLRRAYPGLVSDAA